MFVTHFGGAHSASDFPAQVGVNRHGQTINVNGHLIGISRQSHEHDDISVELLGRAPVNRQNVQSRIPSAVTPIQQQQQQGVRFFRDSDERPDLSLEDMIARVPNNRQTVQLTPGQQQRVRLFRDSEERHDISVEDLISRVPNRQHPIQSRKLPIQQGVGHVFLDSDENDVSDEVNFDLLPELLRLFKPAVPNRVPSAVVNNQGGSVNQPPMAINQQQQGQGQARYIENPSASLEFQEILANPTFQQRIQEIDERLKRAPAARGKRLMEKYATALAIYSSPSNGGSPGSISSSSSYFLPFFIACFWVRLF